MPEDPTRSQYDENIIARSAPQEVSEIDLYKKREKIYTRKIEGFFQRIRLFTGWPLLLGFFILPWLSLGDRPAVLFDLPARQFHILWLTIWPQDLSILGLVLISSAFSLFVITTLAGRVWCGYTCPQTVWTAIFMWIEQTTEGTRNVRMRLDQEPWSLSKILKKTSKHVMWLGFALLTGITFIAYFVPMTSMLSDALSLELGITTLSWIVFFTLATYINAGWAREQLCQYICPYARFQSAMFDRNTLIISYDKKRGEPRGSRKRNLSEKDIDKGACVDCKLCVQVCPTGIDIRDGLQYECISCALCIDACNNVMDKMGYARGLIRYTTEYALLNGKKITFESVFKRWKVLGYLAVLLVVISILGFRLASIEPIELIVRPDRQAILTAVDSESVSQRYQIKIVNKKDEYLKAKLTLDAGDYYVLHAPDLITLPASQVITFPVSIELSKDNLGDVITPVVPVSFKLDVDNKSYSVMSRFIVKGR